MESQKKQRAEMNVTWKRASIIAMKVELMRNMSGKSGSEMENISHLLDFSMKVKKVNSPS